MPTYDYKCEKCSNIFEKFHGMSETPEVTCPECGAMSHRQISGGAGIHFKGAGFYTTDYKAPSKPVEKPAVSSCASGSCGCA